MARWDCRQGMWDCRPVRSASIEAKSGCKPARSGYMPGTWGCMLEKWDCTPERLGYRPEKWDCTRGMLGCMPGKSVNTAGKSANRQATSGCRRAMPASIEVKLESKLGLKSHHRYHNFHSQSPDHSYHLRGSRLERNWPHQQLD